MRRRDDGTLELRVNGVFVMDDAETRSERLLARQVLDRGARRILVGGLGLGFTLRELLAGDVDRVIVAELEPDVVCWMRDGTVPGADLLADPRTEVRLADVTDVIRAQPDGSLDAVVLDVDNGPDFLVHPHNAAVYCDPMAAECARVLRPGGTLWVWSMADSATLRDTLARHFTAVRATAVPVTLQDRDETYWLVGGVRSGG